MNARETEFVDSLKALMIRYDVEIEDYGDEEVCVYSFVSKNKKLKRKENIDINIGDIE